MAALSRSPPSSPWASIMMDGGKFSAWTSAPPGPRHSAPSSCASCGGAVYAASSWWSWMPRRHQGRVSKVLTTSWQRCPRPLHAQCARPRRARAGGAWSPPSSSPPLRKTTRSSQAAMAQSRRPVATLDPKKSPRLMNEAEPGVLAFMSFPTSHRD
jgi:hypothetical protein